MAGSLPSGFGYQMPQQNAWDRHNITGVPGATQGNPTARPNFTGGGYFNQMAHQQTPFGAPQGQQANPYGSFFESPQYGGSFAPFGSVNQYGAYARGLGGGTGSLYQPGGGYGGFGGFGGFGGLYQQPNPYQSPQAFHGGFGQGPQQQVGIGAPSQAMMAPQQYGGYGGGFGGGYGGNPYMRYGGRPSGGFGHFGRAGMRGY